MFTTTLKHKIGRRVDTIKKSLDNSMLPITNKKDSYISGTIAPLIKVQSCKKVTENYGTLHAVIRVLSSDLISNEFNFIVNNDPNNLHETLDEFWKENKVELRKAIEQYLAYGFSACEICMDKETGTIPIRLQQIPSETLTIKRETYHGLKYHYAIYKKDNEQFKFRITREDYDSITIEEDESVGYCIWFGGGTTSRWYTKPNWTPCYMDILTAMKKKSLDYDVIANGNIPKAALFIKGPPDANQDNELGTADSLKRQFEQSKGGVTISYVETPMGNNTLETEYVNIQNENYDYLADLIRATDDIILTCYRVPKVRLMIDDTKESMNSNKSETIYEIYTLDLINYQIPIEQEINIFNSQFYDIDATCDIATPVFTDTKQVQVDTISSLYDIGIISLKQAIKMIAKLYPDSEWTDIDIDDPELNQRFYHGMLFSTPQAESEMSSLIMNDIRGGYSDEVIYQQENSVENGEQPIPPRNLFGR